MDMLKFFQTIIPSDGYKYLCEITAKGAKHHTAYMDFESMVEAASKMVAENKPFYHACASYKELEYNEWGYVVGRKQANVKLLKSLWQDFDVGKYEKDGTTLKPFCYATRNDATAAIAKLMKEVGLPRPLLVSSGSGYHAYWPFTEAVTPAEWHKLTAMVRTVYISLGIKFDPSRDMDSASILRPVGSFNKGVEVKVVREQEPKPYAFYHELFERYITKQDLSVVPTREPKEKLENELGGGQEFPPSNLRLVADHCEQMKYFRDTGCPESEPLWHRLLGVAKHCVEGEATAHDWSAKDQQYTKDQTQEKLDNWTYGPTTCEEIESKSPERCLACKYKGKISSPIRLGYTEETVAPNITIEVEPGVVVNEKPPHWPMGFHVTPSGILELILKDEDGVPSPVRVAAPLFYLTERIRMEDGTYAYTARMNVKNNIWREFQLPAKITADPRTLKAYLASFEILTYNDKLMTNYVQAYADALRRHVDEINTFKQFGWSKDREGFLIGTSFVTANGRKEVRVSNEYVRDTDLFDAGILRGDKQEWSKGVDTLYNRENGEAYRYTICTAFGAPLMPLLEFDAWHGIPLAVTSSDSGHGKSTVCKIAINALCDSRKTTIANTTFNGVMGRASLMNNLPFLVDEISAYIQDPEEVSKMCYSLSNGRAKIGMQSDGRERSPLPPFKLGALITGNKNLFLELNKTKHNPEATQMRLFEVNMDAYPRMDSLTKESTIHAEHAAITNRLIDRCHGVWADDYFNFVFANRTDIEARLYKTVDAIIRTLGGDAAKERFYAYHMACAMVGGWIAKKIGAISFDLTELKHWAFNHIIQLRELVGTYSENVEEKFSHLLAELHGSILVTKHFDLLDTKSNNTEMPMLPMRQGFNARLVLGSDKERGKLFITVRALDEWCSKQGISPTVFRRQLSAANMLRTSGEQGRGFDRKVSIGRGVPSMPTGRSRCLEFDFAAAQGYVEDYVNASNVVPITQAAAQPVVSKELPVSTVQQDF